MIIPHVDLRSGHGPIRDQQARPTCLAFSLSDLNGFQHKLPGMLSPEYLYREAARLTPGWMPHQGTWLDAALLAIDTPGQPEEANDPYQQDEPALPLVSAAKAPLYSGAYKKLPCAIATLDHALLVAGHSVGLAINLTPEFLTPDPGHAVIAFSPAFLPGSGHAVLVVGKGEHSVNGETHYLIRNSWGPSWGADGHAWLSQRYIDTHALRIFGV